MKMNILEFPFVGVYELRKTLPLLLKRLQSDDGSIVVTKKGQPKAMLLSLKKYLEIKMVNEELEEAMKELADKDYLMELLKGQKEIRAGKGKGVKKVFDELGI